MERSSPSRVDDVAFVEEIMVTKLSSCVSMKEKDKQIRPRGFDSCLVSEETTRNVNLFTPNDYYLLAGKNLFRDDRSQPTEKVTLAIDDDRRRRERGHFGSLSE